MQCCYCCCCRSCFYFCFCYCHCDCHCQCDCGCGCDCYCCCCSMRKSLLRRFMASVSRGSSHFASQTAGSVHLQSGTCCGVSSAACSAHLRAALRSPLPTGMSAPAVRPEHACRLRQSAVWRPRSCSMPCHSTLRSLAFRASSSSSRSFTMCTSLWHPRAPHALRCGLCADPPP